MLNTATMGRDGALTIPPAMRRKLGLAEGTPVRIEETGEGLIIRPMLPEAEIYSPERKAEFLLNNAIGMNDYQAARLTVQAMGINPDAIPHERPE